MKKRQCAHLPPSLERDAQSLYNSLWARPVHAKHFIAPTPVSLERKHLGNLLNTHVVAEKNDGERMMLLVGFPEIAHEDSYIVFVNRSRALTVVARPTGKIKGSAHFHAEAEPQSIELCNGTLLDGELMHDGSFVIFDCVAAGGYDTKGLTSFQDRLRVARSCCEALQPFLTCRVKRFFSVDHCMSVFENPAGPADGLILMPEDEVVRTGRHENMFKWKPASKCTIDLMWYNGSEFRAVGDAGQPVSPTMSVGTVSMVPPTPDTPLISNMIYEIGPPAPPTHGATHGATHGEASKWSIIGPRPDKIAANHILTIRRTLRTIRDNILPQEIV